MHFLRAVNNKSGNFRLLLFLILVTWILSALMLIFIDLQISIALVNYDSSWGEFVALYGEIPGHIIISISIFLLLGYKVKQAKSSSDLIFWFGLTINSVFVLGIILTIFTGHSLEFRDGVLITGLILICQFVALTHLKDKTIYNSDKCSKFARLTLILAIVNPLLFVQSFKILWGRTRFRDLSGDFNEFTPWFIPQGVTGHRSFPSGHTAMGWMILPLLFLLPKTGKTRQVLQGVIFSWGMFVAIGRVVIGAHYASDVLFSSGMAFFVYFLLISDWKDSNSLGEIQNRNKS